MRRLAWVSSDLRTRCGLLDQSTLFLEQLCFFIGHSHLVITKCEHLERRPNGLGVLLPLCKKKKNMVTEKKK